MDERQETVEIIKLKFRVRHVILEEGKQFEQAFLDANSATSNPQPSEVMVNIPEAIPDGWPVFNAPRPLYGQMAWRGQFLSGIFYTAVDPADRWSDGFIKRNHENDASLVKFVTHQDILAEVVTYYKERVAGGTEKYPSLYDRVIDIWGEPDQWPMREVRDTFYNSIAGDITETLEIDPDRTGGLL